MSRAHLAILASLGLARRDDAEDRVERERRDERGTPLLALWRLLLRRRRGRSALAAALAVRRHR